MNERYPLAKYHGERPPAPDWFKKAIETTGVNQAVIVDGANVTYKQWGDPKKPGLLLVHGNAAHANWFDFIAPFFMDNYNVVAMTFTGMGDSGWRDDYGTNQYVADQIGVLKHTGMLAHSEKPIIAAHSYGGVISIAVAAQIGDQIKGLVTLDTTIFPPSVDLEAQRPKFSGNVPFFPDLKSALARFRLIPGQPCKNDFIVDHIARNSVKQVERNAEVGWTWKLDPELWDKMGLIETGAWDLIPTVPCRLAFLRGERSVLLTKEVKKGMLSQRKAPFITIKNAGHHVFLDNPLDTVFELKELFETWS